MQAVLVIWPNIRVIGNTAVVSCNKLCWNFLNNSEIWLDENFSSEDENFSSEMEYCKSFCCTLFNLKKNHIIKKGSFWSQNWI